MLRSYNTFKFINYYKGGQLIGRFTLVESIHAEKIIAERYNIPIFMLHRAGITTKKEY